MNLDVACSIDAIRQQLKKLPASPHLYDRLHRLETERAQTTGRPYRSSVTTLLTSVRKRIEKRGKHSIQRRKDGRAKANGGSGRPGRKDGRAKANGGSGRKDGRAKANGGSGRTDYRNNVRGGIGRETKNTFADSVKARTSEDHIARCEGHELRDFWWAHWADAAVLASCCASHEAAMHTFWSDEEWMLQIAASTTGMHA